MLARYTGPDQKNFYVGLVYNANGVYQAYLALNKAGVFTQLAEHDLVGFTGGGNLRFEVVGKQLKLFVNNVLQTIAYDANLASAGTVGLRSFGATYDNFNVSAVQSLSTTLPAQDSFTSLIGSTRSTWAA